MKRAAILALVLLAGCKAGRKPVQVVMLIDISASIDGNSSKLERSAEAMVSSLKMGDEVTVFPICDSSYASQAEPMRFEVPGKREAFNEETSRFRRDFRSYAQKITGDAKCKKTFILDTIARASGAPGEMYILTDGIEESEIDFTSDRRLGSPKDAERLATKLASGKPQLNRKVRLGLVGSKSFDVLPAQRQYAIVSFWKTYLFDLGGDVQVESASLLSEP